MKKLVIVGILGALSLPFVPPFNGTSQKKVSKYSINTFDTLDLSHLKDGINYEINTLKTKVHENDSVFVINKKLKTINKKLKKEIEVLKDSLEVIEDSVYQ